MSPQDFMDEIEKAKSKGSIKYQEYKERILERINLMNQLLGFLQKNNLKYIFYDQSANLNIKNKLIMVYLNNYPDTNNIHSYDIYVIENKNIDFTRYMFFENLTKRIEELINEN